MENTKEQIISEIIEGDLQVLYNLLETVKNDSEELKKAYKKVKEGIGIKYHIEWNLKGYHEIRERQGIVILNSQQYELEEWWDEEENRRSIAREALLEYYMEEEQRYERR